MWTLVGTSLQLPSMTQQRWETREATARNESASKMVPRQPDTPARGGDRAAEAASKLERFARTPHKAQPHVPEPQALPDEEAGGSDDPAPVVPQTQQAQAPLQAAGASHEVSGRNSPYG